MDQDDDFFDKCLEGFAMFTLNQGEVCTCPSRVLIQESIYDKFMERAIARTKSSQARQSSKNGNYDWRSSIIRTNGKNKNLT